jgi:nucleoside 2-deoxyribosyltransferase
MDINISTILFSAVISIVIAASTWLMSKRLKKTRYNENENKVILESIRSSLETQIYSLNDRLIQSEERWKDVNHLLLHNEYLKNEAPLTSSRKTHYSDFLKSNGIAENDLLIDSKLIFVLTPFHKAFDVDFITIRELCTSFGFKCIRGDESNFKSDIFPEILKLIVKSRLIIANVNGRNPNVMYELGIAQAIDKPIVLISKEPENLPIDVKSKRFLIYKDYNELQLMLREVLNSF